MNNAIQTQIMIQTNAIIEHEYSQALTAKPSILPLNQPKCVHGK